MPEHLWCRKLAHGIVGHDPASHLLRPLGHRFAHAAWSLNTLRLRLSGRECQQKKSDHQQWTTLSKHCYPPPVIRMGRFPTKLADSITTRRKSTKVKSDPEKHDLATNLAAALAISIERSGRIQQRRLIGGIGNACADDAGEGRERMFFRLGGADNFEDADFANHESVGEERAVAAPRNRLRTDQRGRARCGELDGSVERGFNLRRLHVVRIAGKAPVAPTARWARRLV